MLEGYLRDGDRLRSIREMDGWTSPRLGIRFVLGREELRIIRPDGQPFVTFEEMTARANDASARADEASARAEIERRLADRERERAEREQGRAEAEKGRAERLAAQLRALGIEPEG